MVIPCVSQRADDKRLWHDRVMYAVILAGGGGTRLWPLSRSARPKPFLPLIAGRSLLEGTVARIAPIIALEDVHVVTDVRYVDFVRELIPALPATNILAEPTGRNTAAAVAYAAVAIERRPDEVMVVLPADHVVTDEAAFRDALRAAVGRAGHGDMVTLGIRPTAPLTGYGYVLATGEPEEADGRVSFRVARFEEKPSLERAAELIEGAAASWNAGIFVWRRDTLLEGLAAHAPDILGPIRDALHPEIASGGSPRPEVLAAGYADLRATSIDYALLEPASLEGRVAVVPVDCGWSDVGSWAALREALARDPSDPSRSALLQSQGEAEIVDIGSWDVLVQAAGGRLVAVIGLRGLIVVDTPDALLVCSPEAAQDVRRVVERLAEEGRSELL
jgi:mannose-1-phosphate guanylyltransferase/mannose-6-phosphate isomerase